MTSGELFMLIGSRMHRDISEAEPAAEVATTYRFCYILEALPPKQMEVS